MLGKFFKKARETVSGISDAVRGVEHVDWITHAFPYSLEMLMDVDEARDPRRRGRAPRPPPPPPPGRPRPGRRPVRRCLVRDLGAGARRARRAGAGRRGR